MQVGHRSSFPQYMQCSTDVIVDMKGNDKTVLPSRTSYKFATDSSQWVGFLVCCFGVF